MQQYLTLDEAAKKLGMTPDDLREMAKKKTIRAFQDRGSWRFRNQDIEELARQRGAGSDPEVSLGEGKAPATKKTGDSGRLPADFTLDDETAPIGREKASPGSKSGKASQSPRPGSDSDVRLVLDSNMDFAVDPDSDAKVELGGPRSGPRKGGNAGDSGVRLVPQEDPSDSDVKVVPSSKDSGVSKKGKSPSDSDIRLQDLESGAGSRKKGEPGPITEEIDLDAEEASLAEKSKSKPGKGAKVTQYAPPVLPTESPFELSEPDLNLGGKKSGSKGSKPGKTPKKETDSSSDFELVPFDDSKAGVNLASGEIPLLPDDDAVSFGSEVSGPNAGNSGINLQDPADSGISLEGGSSDEIEFELSLDSGATPKPAKSSPKAAPKSAAKSTPKAKVEEDSSSEFDLSLDDDSSSSQMEDSDSEFELSLDDSGSVELNKDDANSDSEFELTLDEEGALASADEDAGDIFEETSFDVPALEDESGSEAVALDDSSSETDLEGLDSDFEISMDDSSSEEDSGSQVVNIDDDADDGAATVAKPRKKALAAVGKKGKPAAEPAEEDDAPAFDEIDEEPAPKKGGRAKPAAAAEEDEEDSADGIPAAEAPAEWGALPAVILFPTVMVMFVVGVMGFELLRGMWGYRRPSPVGKPVVDAIARTFDDTLPK